ncbi:hypothetical protein XCR1_2410022 [Xenorhabdus cabanillasii JM26]|uniref:Uncharacterized protein n=1 Tax=Xenorhabdus cabanillasii JM26 TaxID=1427517 RepID=W1J8K6_9GAMM|nr:hypothetical protein XCR1_2410022 [Xenorhabdus cabanillasii JM26]
MIREQYDLLASLILKTFSHSEYEYLTDTKLDVCIYHIHYSECNNK